MKFKLSLIALLALLVVAWTSYPIAARWKENERRRALRDIPQAERSLRVPTKQRLSAAFPQGSMEILRNSQKIILFSVTPYQNYDSKIGDSKPAFHGHEVLGQTTIVGAGAKTSLLSSLYDGLVPYHSKALMYGCFSPRHGVRATHNGKTVDLLICFSCHQMHVYQNNASEFSNTFISDAPEPTFNRILTAAHIPISE